ncbi:MAG: NADH-dependent [FeFe] hydrogenase, group A6 [Anaeromicrobium sp.]|jgi:iron-only hydrogenase group A|uniref:NADH-dependent [FeFe] hydrogenase, group A6 n=1 Tax=Anaeromicrobium sp. TaxID=1929132 RepID=UPI0025D41855|nr:NADH-dependent [FeFe] hydrogenase, group A6 [Anaeromicrobium sp.]MCT4595207.1 NADH-dependent [FeFe] hydrogenase, group A6 [Anaeromicrobium sp.]
MVNLTIDNKNVIVEENSTILEAAKKLHIHIPTLCYHPDQTIKANCRICLVETDNKKLVPACSTKVKEGMNILTNSKFVREAQRGVLELILANHNQDCLKCIRNGNCELQTLCERFNISHNSLEGDAVESHPMDDFNPSIVRDYSKCIKCGRCVEVCSSIQNVNVLACANRSTSYEILPRFDKKLHETECVFCGQCIKVCPVGAIYEKDSINNVLNALDDPNMHVIVQIAPAVRVSIGEEFNLNPGEITTGKIVSSLKRIGFNKVFDTNFTADLTIIEEGHELINRIENGGVLPMITSCSPGWINYVETFAPDLIDHLSTCKSPQQMFGALSKTYYSQKTGIHPSKIFTVSIMPCTAKKFEANRKEMNSYGYVDVDSVLTTREFSKLIKSKGIDFRYIEDEQFDNPFGITTGAGAIFGATGGVMEAALRSVYELLTKESLSNIDFKDVRGTKGHKEAIVNINGTPIKVAVAHGLKNASVILDEIRRGKSDYAFVEIMACPGGCIGGGGQPINIDPKINEKRIDAIYEVDKNMEIRKSHENPAIKELYEDFLGEPLGELSHKLLHTHYHSRF